MNTRRVLLAVMVLWSVLLTPVYSQNEVHFKLDPGVKSVKEGQRFMAILRAEIAQGWHLYSTTQPEGGPIATRIQVAENDFFQQAGSVVQPPVIRSYDSNFNLETEYFEGSVDFMVPVAVKESAPAGAGPLTLQVRYMLCSDTLCLPPQDRTVKASLTVVGGAAKSPGKKEPPATASKRQTPASTAPAEKERVSRSPGAVPVAVPNTSGTTGANPAMDRATAASAEAAANVEMNGAALPTSTLAYIWFAMAMGALALLTPCVFPMIPITVSYFTKREAVSRKKAAGEAGLYSLGIVLTFTLLGFLLTFLFGAGGINRLASNPVVNVVIALVFILFALSLFGVVELRLPASWLSRVDKSSSSRGGLVGILLMALTFSLTSFTCTVPFVGTVMVAALHGNWAWSLLGVASFATVFAAPFFILALFPSWLQSLPKSGNWMNSVKITMGFLELAAALKFVSNVDLVYQWQFLTRPVFIAVWLSISLITALYLLGRFHFPHETASQGIGALRVLSAVVFLSVALYLLRGLFGFPLGELDAFLPPKDYGRTVAVSMLGNTGASQEPRWLDSYRAGLLQARKQNRPVFIDFTGYTCTNCRWMEANVFSLPEVQDLFGRFVLVRLYTDGPDQVHADNLKFEQTRFNTIALPFYAIFSPDDRVLATFPGLTRDRSEFIDFLKKGLALHQQGSMSLAMGPGPK